MTSLAALACARVRPDQRGESRRRPPPFHLLADAAFSRPRCYRAVRTSSLRSVASIRSPGADPHCAEQHRGYAHGF